MRSRSESLHGYRLARIVPQAGKGLSSMHLLWMARTGAPWRDLPERLGKWSVVYQRYAYWCDKGYLERLFQGV